MSELELKSLGAVEWSHIELVTSYIYYNRRWKNRLDVIQAGYCWVTLGTAVVVSSVCYCVELLLYNAAPVASVCKGTVDLMDWFSYLRWWLIKFFQRWEGELISYISWCTFSLEIVLCLSRQTVYVTFENMERVGSASCVWGSDYLWCSFATIVRTSACEVDDLWRRCAAGSFPCEHKWRSCKTARTENTPLHNVAKGHPPHTPTYVQSLQRYVIDSM